MRDLKINQQDGALPRYWFAHKQRLFFGVWIALISILLSGNFLNKYSQDHARILRFSGAVSLERAGEKISLVIGTLLNAQDKITTGQDAFVEVAYDDMHKDVLRIGAESRVVLESAVIEKKTNIFMDRGQIILKLEKLEKGSTFKIRTPIAIAGVRGTSFGVKLIGDQAIITDYESKIFVKGLTEDFIEMKDELLLSDGWKVQVRRFEKPSQVERITPQEYAVWQAWLDEIACLSIPASTGNSFFCKLAFFQGEIFRKYESFSLSKMMMKLTLSASFLAFILYLALVANLEKVFIRTI